MDKVQNSNYVEWNKLDLGKAVTRVMLGPAWCDIDGPPHQQELYFADSPDIEQLLDNNINTADRFMDKHESAASRWRAVPQLEAYILSANFTPGAPRFTFATGSLGKSPGFPYGDLYCPDDSKNFILNIPPQQPLQKNPSPSNNQQKTDQSLSINNTKSNNRSVFTLSKAPSISEVAGGASSAKKGNIQSLKIKTDTCPFIPTIISNLGQFEGQYRQKLKESSYAGVPTWNIWEAVSPDKIPIVPDLPLLPRSGHVTLRTVGNIYDCTRVQVIANNTHTFIRRAFPLYKDTGFVVPWVFPYLDKNEEIKYLFYNKNIDEKELHNIGGIYSFTLTNYVFTSDNNNNNDTNMSGVVFFWGSNSDVAIYFLINKKPYVIINNRIDDAILLSNNIVKPGVEYTLKIEYIGPNLSIQIIGEKEVVVRCKEHEKYQPVFFFDYANYKPFFFCINCTVVFDFSICYYNNWDPNQEKIPKDFKFNLEHPNVEQGISTIHKMMNIIYYNDTGDSYSLSTTLESIHDTMLKKSISIKEIIRETNGMNIFDIGFPSVVYNSSLYEKGFRLHAEPIDEEELPHNIQTPISEGVNTEDHIKICIRPLVSSIYASPVFYSALIIGDPKIEWGHNFVDITNYVNNWTVSWSTQEDYKMMIANASVTLINPPIDIMEAASNNLFWIKIEDTGYITESNNDSLYKKNIFHGIVTNIRTQVDKSGRITYTLNCEDASFLLRNMFIITNLRFDGMSYLNALRSLWNRTLIGIPLLLRDNNGEEHILSPAEYEQLLEITHDKIYKMYLHLNFGLEPMAGKSYSVPSGTKLIEPITGILSAMNNKYCYPLFFYDPGALSGKGAFVLSFRDFTGEDKIKVALPPYSSQDIKEYIPLTSDQSAIEFSSDLKNLSAEVRIYGINRFSGKPMNHVRRNKNWKALKRVDVKQWNQYSGHVGFRRIYLEYDNKQLYTTFPSLLRATEEKLYWLSSPVEQVNNLSALGIISPVGNNGLFTLKFGTSYIIKHILLLNSNVSYNAETLTVSSSFSGLILKSISSRIIYENFK